MDAFDADVLIYAAVPGHPLGEQVAALFRSAAPTTAAGLGSVLLLPEVLSRPLRDGAVDEVDLQRMVKGEIPIIPGQATDGFNKGPTPAQYQRTLGGEDSVPYKVPPKSDAASKELSQELELQRPKPKFKP